MAEQKSNSASGMEENLKKSVTEMLILTMLSGEDMYAGQITQTLEERSDGVLHVVFPYAALYRLIDGGYILEAYKKTAPDGRRRQYFQITPEGRAYREALLTAYRTFIGGVNNILEEEGS